MPNTLPDGNQLVDGTLINQFLQQNFNYIDGITALAGGGLSSKTPVCNAGMNRVSVVANIGDSVALPSAVPNPKKDGKSIAIILIVNSGVDSLNVFPQSTDQINDGGAGTQIAQAAGKSALYFCPSPGRWYRLLSA